MCVVSSFEKFQLQQIHAPRQHCIMFLLKQIVNNVFGFTIATAASLFTCLKFHTKYLYVGLALNNVFNVRSYAAMIMYWSSTLQHCATCLHKNVYECHKRLFLNRNLVRTEDTSRLFSFLFERLICVAFSFLFGDPLQLGLRTFNVE